ncbi:S1 RNA-binding domain-containing protein [Neptunomonas japonica]|uniref:GntR family transcriptional regulator n=1 Tax=Neptunomonas japonica JAMM 1380 TaxID=1441457 RepID=A0A7R6PNH7_9GAMM|nr:S1-like domain-containing RNA-binding protein [Neptunomonas japonica]BBB29682.1 GntR family transcriptional regulator [Neptunomonas japonica JAMM 1380]
MVDIGRMNTLTVMREADFGVYLDGGEFGGILLPKKEVPQGCKLGDQLDVFIYLDTDDFVVAGINPPIAQVGEFASLKVVEVNRIGAFLDWGMPKDLLLPYGEQQRAVEVGQRVMVRVYLDNSDRLAASAKLEKFLDKDPKGLTVGDKVSLFAFRHNDLGFSVIVDNSYGAVLHQKDLFRTVRLGQTLTGYIKRVLAEGKVDVMLDKPGYAKVDELSQRILDNLDNNDGFSPLSDKSQPEDIYQAYGISKKAYKMAIGTLMKKGLISIAKDGITKV